MEKKDNTQIFNITYRVFYTDDTGIKREKNLTLTASDESMYFFHNPKTGKTEAIPKRAINRMEAEE